ncbi:cysteine--tRNA ligase, partial [Marinomonas sp. 42_23_T18]
IDYSEQSLLEAKVGLERMYTSLHGQAVADEYVASDYSDRYRKAMDDDFNTPVAISVLFDLVRELNKAKASTAESSSLLAKELVVLAEQLGLLAQDPEYFLKNSVVNDGISEGEIESLIADRIQARKDKDFAKSDEIRDALADQGITLLDTREGTSWTRR